MRNNDSKNHESEITIVDENVAINCMPKILETLDLAKNDKIEIEGVYYNPYHFDDNYYFIDCDGMKSPEILLDVLMGKFKFRKL